MFIVQDAWLPFFLTRRLAMNLDSYVKRDKYDLSDFPKGAIFVDPKKKPVHAGLWVTSVEKFGKTPPATTNWAEVDAALTKELAPLWNGRRAVRDTVQAVKQTVDPLVAQGKWG
jgi:hypothetical protein